MMWQQKAASTDKIDVTIIAFTGAERGKPLPIMFPRIGYWISRLLFRMIDPEVNIEALACSS